MQTSIRLTAKRQATFPRELCEALGLQPGDEIDLVRRREDGEERWLLKKRSPSTRKWTGSLKQYAANAEDHSMKAIRASVAAGRKRGS